MKESSKTVIAVRPVQVIGSIFRLRRDLVGIIKRHVMPGFDLTVEEADLLIDLFGARTMGWTDPVADSEGYVTFEALKLSLVHSDAAFSRRVSELRDAGLVETRKVSAGKDAGPAVDKRKMKVRITKAGIESIRPLFDKHCRVCEGLLRDFSQAEQRDMLRLNEALMKKIRWDG